MSRCEQLEFPLLGGHSDQRKLGESPCDGSPLKSSFGEKETGSRPCLMGGLELTAACRLCLGAASPRTCNSMYHYWAEIADRNYRDALMSQRRPEWASICLSRSEEAERIATELIECMAIPMPSLDAIYEFLRSEYVHSRFEGRNAAWPNGVPERGTYAQCVARSYQTELLESGACLIGPFESRRAALVVFDRALRIVNPDAPPVEKVFRAGSLSAPMSGDWS